MALAHAVTKKIRRSIFDFIYAPSRYDPEQERADAEHVSCMRIEEWAQGDDQTQDEAFRYGSTAGFDPQP